MAMAMAMAMATATVMMEETKTETRATPLRRARNDKFHGESDNGMPAIADYSKAAGSSELPGSNRGLRHYQDAIKLPSLSLLKPYYIAASTVRGEYKTSGSDGIVLLLHCEFTPYSVRAVSGQKGPTHHLGDS
jgi:hypothetical protein